MSTETNEIDLSGKPQFGWIPPPKRTPEQTAFHEATVKAMPRFRVRGRWQMERRRYALWEAPKKLFGRHLKYIWQQTGSCVGAGGCNMLMTLMAVEIAVKGEWEEFLTPWWLYTYGISRWLSGSNGPGEGSFGSAWAKAIKEYGIFQHDPPGMPDLPDFQESEGWLVQPSSVEMTWSAGDQIKEEWKKLGRQHPVRTVAQMRSADDCLEALANGYPITQASMFGFSPMVPRITGDPPVHLAEWNDEWSHQTYVDEVWDHPTLGLLFRWGNNWGSKIHGNPTGEEPPGGTYIKHRTMDQLCKDRNSEVYAFSSYDGFPARDPYFV